MVMQDVFLFSDTVDENVRLGKRALLSRSLVRKAALAASADDFIEKLEQGYDTVIGERGVGLSGGQKQRISAVRHADQILFLEDGRIAESGTHESLLAKKGLYYETYMAQYGEFLKEKEA